VDYLGDLLAVLPRLVKVGLHYGQYGVAIFFTLSGFVIAHSLYGKSITFRVFGRFMLRRSIRLDPPYWLSIIVCFAAYAINAGSADALFRSFSAAQVIAHLLYLQDLLRFDPINNVYWTLCLEVQFYLVYAALLALGQSTLLKTHGGDGKASLLMLAGSVSLLWPLGIVATAPHGLFPPLWHGFLLGVGAYWSWRDRRALPWFLGYTALVAVGAVLAGRPGFSSICAATALVLYVSARSNRIENDMNWRPLQFLGKISYSLYLTHVPVTCLCSARATA
jgi:peptidoglycan/LPS O-acetylase OafA/YrhL